MRFLFTMIIGIVLFTACKTSNSDDTTSTEASSVHKVSVKEVLQTKSYTYLRVKENDADYWMAASKMDAKPGDVLYYEDAMRMQDFRSKELDRFFESILFVQQISHDAGLLKPQMQAAPHGMQKPKANKADINLSPVEGGISIAELFRNRDQYANTKVLIRGQVVKVNEGIMSKNWIHIQDGSSDNGNFDLTITSLETARVGDTVTFEGTVTLNKDFGAGYTYEVMLEDGKLK